MQSMGSFSIFFSLFFFFVDDDDDDDFVDVDDDDGLAVLVVGVLLESILAVVVMFGLFVAVAGSLMGVCLACSLTGVFFLFPPFHYLGPALFFVGAVPSFIF